MKFRIHEYGKMEKSIKNRPVGLMAMPATNTGMYPV